MANSNRVFVSPGVYTSEKDLTFVAQSVGVTTLGLVGETLKGPAFEPILIGNFDEFKTYFGPTSPEKDGANNPKYELAYVAKSYLQESNQLFVTRILGKTGYKPVKTFGIKTLGGVTGGALSGTTTGLTMSATTATITGSTIYSELSTKVATNGEYITTYIVNNRGKSGTAYANNDFFTIGEVPSATIAAQTGVKITSPIGENNENNWYNTFYTKTGATDSTIDGVYSYLFVYDTATGKFNVTRYKYSASLNTDYNGIVVASLRSRGQYSASSQLILEVTGNTSFLLSDVDGIESDPLGEFTINVTGQTGGAKTFTCSLDTTSTKYITKVLGTSVFDKDNGSYPLYVHEVYPNLLDSAFKHGFIRGLSLDEVYNSEGENFLREWDTPSSPTVVSEVRGGNVSDLFSVLTISDGEAANTQVKITIQNINLDTAEFDMMVRDFNDADDNQVVLEKFTRCTMNPDLPGYVARKIGTSDGEYELRSKFIMLNMAADAPTDAFPAGFKGFTSAQLSGSTKLGSVLFKTTFLDAGDTAYYSADGTANLSNGDKVKKVSLGLSSQTGTKFDADLFKYKGDGASLSTFGFHLSTNADSIVDVSGNTIYQTTSYDLEGQSDPTNNKLANINYRKFTFAVCGGFDGWDIYRETRTLGDQYIYGKQTYITGDTANGGVFSISTGNSDYYAYLAGIETFANPEAVDINVFATPGINFYDHSSLTSQAIDIIENDRADSLYVISSPNVDDAATVTGYLDDLGIDSNYSATYWPWIQVRDTDNATQLYIPPTGEVLKNIALTDNVSYPWFAVAGYSRGLVNAIKAKKKLTLDERDELYKNRINPIATFSDTGTIIWGNKTLQVKESALDRINVRRLLLRARKLISAVAVRLLFEQNDEQVRQEFLRLVNPILESIKKERGLYEFKVTVSSDVEDIDANTLRGKIYVKPTRSLEFIDLEFVITPTGASFENI
jgi:hypothetical protein